MNQQAGAKQTGFTLVEVLVVVVIIGILAGLAVPAIFVAMQKVEDGTAIVEVNLVAQALEAYKMKYGEYPPDFTNLEYVIAHLDRLFPRRREFLDDLDPARPLPDATLGFMYYLVQNGVVKRNGEPGLDPDQALLFWLRGFHPDPQFPIRGRLDLSDPLDPQLLTEREPLMEFNNDMIVAVDRNGNQSGLEPDDDLNLDTPGEVLAPSRMRQSPIVYFDRRSTSNKHNYQQPHPYNPGFIPKTFPPLVKPNNETWEEFFERVGGIAVPYLSSEILDQEEREDPGLWTRWDNSPERKNNPKRKSIISIRIHTN